MMIGIVTFSSPAAARTSVLLNNALINKRPITVELVPSDFSLPKKENVVAPEPDFELENLVNHSVPAEERTQTSVVAGLLGKGYQLSSDTFQRAKEFDQKYAISKQMDQSWTEFTVNVNNFDEFYRISENGEKLKETVATKYREVDAQYDISGGVQKVGVGINHLIDGASRSVQTGFEFAAGAIGNFIQTNPAVQQKLDEVKTAGNSAYNQAATYF